MILVKGDSGYEEFLPFVGRNPHKALSDVMRKTGKPTRFEPHKKDGGEDVLG